MGRIRAVGVVLTAILVCLGMAATARAQTPVASDFQKVTLDDNTQNPMELDVANDGRVFYIERDGRLQIWKPDTQQTVTAGHDPGHAQPGERPARPAARAGLRHQQVGLPLLLAAAGQHAHAGRLALQGQRRHARPVLGAEDPHLHAPDAGVLPLVRRAVLRPRRQPLHLDGRQHQPVRLRRLRPDRRARRPRALGRAAHRGQHERPQRQDPAHQAAGSPPARPASARRTRSRPTTSSPRPGHDNKTRPEIFGMGFRNPFRFTVDRRRAGC